MTPARAREAPQRERRELALGFPRPAPRSPQQPAPLLSPPAPGKPCLRAAWAAERPAQPGSCPRAHPSPGPGQIFAAVCPQAATRPRPLSCAAPPAPPLPSGAGQGRPHCPPRPRGPSGTRLGGPPPPARCACPAHLHRRARRASARQPGSRLSDPSQRRAHSLRAGLGVAAQGGTGRGAAPPRPEPPGAPGKGRGRAGTGGPRPLPAARDSFEILRGVEAGPGRPRNK